MSNRIAIYGGSFDPVTKGHIDIIKYSCLLFDKLVIAIAADSKKDTFFSIKFVNDSLRPVLPLAEMIRS